MSRPLDETVRALEARLARLEAAEEIRRLKARYFVKPRIEVLRERARGSWDLLAPCTTQEGVAAWMAGVEDDEYARVDGRWLHASMRLRVVFFAPHERGFSPRS